MCGLAGFINYSLNEQFREDVHKIQGHRGPDSKGDYHNEKIMLLHQRLSIIDLDVRSAQPFIKGNLILVFNGEIYNYKDLKSEILTKHSIEFKTTSDTEVLLELYRIHGKECLQMIRGMFAFAIYNKESGETFLARDHFGIKPLFYTSEGNRFAFASELKTLTLLPDFNTEMNTTQLVAGVNYLWVPGDEAIFKNVYKVPAGHFLTITSDGKFEKHKYYNPEEDIVTSSEEENIAHLDQTFRESVEMHMTADVPVSAFLSGGLDSSLICALASGYSSGLSTYTIGTSPQDKLIEKMPADERYAAKLATSMGFDHHEIIVKPNIVENLPFITRMLDEPIGDPAAINTWLICKAAHESGVKVMLSGMGADELFFGYRRQMATLKAASFQKLPKALRNSIKSMTEFLPVKAFGKGIKWTRWAKRFMGFANMEIDEAYRRSYSYYENKGLAGLFNKDITEEIHDIENAHSSVFNSAYRGDPVNQMCRTDISFFMNGLNLTYTDRAAMAASVEVRVPFVDKEVVQLAMQTPANLKYKGGEQKYLLKKMAEKYLPKDIIYRPKASFGAPIRSWISNDLSEMVGDMLSEKVIRERGIFNEKKVVKMIDDDRKGKSDYAYQLYYLLTLEHWMKYYMDKK